MSEVRIPTQTNMDKMWLTWNSKMMPELILFSFSLKHLSEGLCGSETSDQFYDRETPMGVEFLKLCLAIEPLGTKRYKKKTDEIVRL